MIRNVASFFVACIGGNNQHFTKEFPSVASPPQDFNDLL
jgi:hypothetical protein